MFDRPQSRQSHEGFSEKSSKASVTTEFDLAAPLNLESTLPSPGDDDRLEGRSQMLPSTSAIAAPTLDEESSFMTLFSDTYDSIENVFNNFGLQQDDASYFYDGKQLMPIYSPNLPTMLMQAAATETSPSSGLAIRPHFTKIDVKTGIQQMCATLIIDMIHAYPRMMTRRETLPPFVHPCSYAEDDRDKLPVNLTNCMGIAQLFAARTVDTHAFVWSTVRAETRGMRDRLLNFDKYDALSALQASLLYAIMRAVDERPQEAADDWEMLMIYDVCYTLSSGDAIGS